MTAAASRRVTAAQAGVLLVAALVAALIASARGSSAATPVRYETVAVTTGAVTDRISATGSVAAQATVDLAFGTTGQRVTAVDVHPGQTVAKGQLLLNVSNQVDDAYADDRADGADGHERAVDRFKSVRAIAAPDGRRHHDQDLHNHERRPVHPDVRQLDLRRP